MNLIYALCFIGFCGALTPQNDSPDVRLLKKMARHAWRNRHSLLPDVGGRFDDSGEQLKVDCSTCLLFVSTLQGLISQGVTFEDIRDAAVRICYNVTAGMGYDGDVICEGVIDNYGPYVYDTMNATDLGARAICEFHTACDGQTEIEVTMKSSSNVRLPELARWQGRRPHKADMLRVAHVTDLHVDALYSVGAPTRCELPLCCRDYWDGTGVANEWGEYSCNLPLATAEHMLRALAQLEPHVVMQTGDTPPHAIWEESLHGQLAYSRWAAEALERLLPGVPAYACIGNHDTFPTNMYYGDRADIQQLNRNLTDMYERLSNWTDEARETMAISGFYVMPLTPGLKVMAVNSNFGTTENFHGVLLPDSFGWLSQRDYINEAFLDARANGEKVILLHHHTIGSGFAYYVSWINQMMETYGDVILFQLQGHSHGDDFQLSSDVDLTPTSVMFTSSTLGTRTDRNPAIRVYYIDPLTLIPLEYDHFILNLTAANELPAGEMPEVKLFYNTFDAYGLLDLTAQSMDDFVERMITDDALYYLYQWHSTTGVDEPDECVDDCRVRFACDIRTSSAEREAQCLEQTLA